MDSNGVKPRETIMQLARACYKRLCPWCPPDLPVHKSTTMQAYLEGCVISEQMLSRERDIWHTLHLGLNNELGAYKILVKEIYECDLDEKQWVIHVMGLLIAFGKSNNRLSKDFYDKLLSTYPGLPIHNIKDIV